MSPKHPVAQLDMSSLRVSAFHYDFSSYPPTSPSGESSDEEDLPPTSKTSLRSSIAELPDAKLRAILVKLVDTNPRFQRAITKELASARVVGDSPPLSAPTSPRARRSKPRQRAKTIPEAQIQLPALPPLHEEPVYHPGRSRPAITVVALLLIQPQVISKRKCTSSSRRGRTRPRSLRYAQSRCGAAATRTNGARAAGYQILTCIVCRAIHTLSFRSKTSSLIRIWSGRARTLRTKRSRRQAPTTCKQPS